MTYLDGAEVCWLENWSQAMFTLRLGVVVGAWVVEGRVGGAFGELNNWAELR